MNLPAADHVLTNAEIDALYGDMLREGVLAFRADPTYIVEMMEHYSSIIRKRERRRSVAKSAPAEPQPDPRAERNARIVKWRETGATVNEMAKEFGMSRSGIEYVLRREAPKLLKRRTKSSRYAQRAARVVKLRKQNLKLKEIAEIVGSDTSTVSMILKDAGLGQTRVGWLQPEERAERDRLIQAATGTISDISRQFGLSRARIRTIRNRESEK